jgi:hypothetical protein
MTLALLEFELLTMKEEEEAWVWSHSLLLLGFIAFFYLCEKNCPQPTTMFLAIPPKDHKNTSIHNS